MGETLKMGTHLDIESELNLIKGTRRELRNNHCSTEIVERKTMKELGLKRSEIKKTYLHMYTLCHFATYVVYANLIHLAHMFLCTNE
jgi:hypothetical protein